jgi:hypothetical protein
MGEAGRKKVEQTYAAPIIAKRHIALYIEEGRVQCFLLL